MLLYTLENGLKWKSLSKQNGDRAEVIKRLSCKHKSCPTVSDVQLFLVADGLDNHWVRLYGGKCVFM